MKVLVIPDIHGKIVWKSAIENHPHDFLIFLGDYVDASLEISDKQIKENLTEIIELKSNNPQNIILLLGNHDIQYMFYPHHSCSGFRENIQPILTELYDRNSQLFQIAYQHNNYLFTHAGVSENWYNKHVDHFIFPGMLANNLNTIHRTPNRNILHEVGAVRGGFGNGPQQGGPTWADKSETKDSMVTGYHQIVGHSKVRGITKIYKQEDTSFTYCDCLDWEEEFLTLNT